MAAPAVGTIIQYFNKTDSSWESLGGVSDISGPDFSKDEIEVTALDTSGGFKSYIGGLKDAGNMTLEMNFTQASFAILFDIFLKEGDDGEFWFAVILNDPPRDDDDVTDRTASPQQTRSAFWFQASINQTPIRASAGDRVTATVTLRISGEPKFGLAGGDARVQDGTPFGKDNILPGYGGSPAQASPVALTRKERLFRNSATTLTSRSGLSTGSPGGTYDHLPNNNWKKIDPGPSATEDSYYVERTATYSALPLSAETFTSATAWGTITKKADKTGA